MPTGHIPAQSRIDIVHQLPSRLLLPIRDTALGASLPSGYVQLNGEYDHVLLLPLRLYVPNLSHATSGHVPPRHLQPSQLDLLHEM